MLFKTMEFYVHPYVSLQIRNNEKVTTATINRIMLLLIELAKVSLIETINEKWNSYFRYLRLPLSNSNNFIFKHFK